MKPFSEWDFTLKRYERLCKTFIDYGYKVTPILDYLTHKRNFQAKYVVILRHDVDRKPFNALKMAQVEADLGIKSTYYFRAKRSVFNPSVIRKIAHLRHEIGYHYENLADKHGDMERAIRDFEINLSKFRKLVPVKTICMHGSPLSKWDNRHLWKKYDYKDFGIIGEPYLSIDYKDIVYVTDTGRTWNSDKFSIRDKVTSNIKLQINSTTDLIRILRSKVYRVFFIQCHPERWAVNLFEWSFSLLRDYLINLVKVCPIMRTSS